MTDTIALDSIDRVFEVLRLSNTAVFGDETRSGWLFRGHADPDWKLVPSVWRDDFLPRYASPNAHVPELVKSALQRQIEVNPWVEVLFLCPDARDRLPEVLERLLTEYALVRAFFLMAHDLALTADKQPWPSTQSGIEPTAATLLDEQDLEPHTIAQHYGIPTRCLDWTRDPLTALFFALEGATDSRELTIWAFDSNAYQARVKPGYQPAEHQLWVRGGSGFDNRYLHAQRGAFTFVFRGEVTYLATGEYPGVEQIVPDELLKRFSIPVTADDKVNLALRLLRERRTKAHLIPDLRSCAKVAASTFRLGLNI